MPGRPELPDLTSPRRLQFYLEQRGLRPRRGWGQNFLIDGNIAHKIIEAAGLSAGDPVVEIGPGAGALTTILARRDVPVVALELDRGLAAALEDLLRPFPHIKVLQQDALQQKWAELNRFYFADYGEVHLLSNLPYHISGPLFYDLFKQNFPFKKALFMLQKEVALRLTAVPDSVSYGALSVLSRYYVRAEILFSVSRHVFWPPPNVDSMVVKMQPRHRSLGPGEERLFWGVVEGSFQQRRKVLSNSLRDFIPSRESLLSILQKAGVDPRVRAETLDVEQFAKIAQIAYNCNVNHS